MLLLVKHLNVSLQVDTFPLISIVNAFPFEYFGANSKAEITTKVGVCITKRTGSVRNTTGVNVQFQIYNTRGTVGTRSII